jgi:hypothetical protein
MAGISVGAMEGTGLERLFWASGIENTSIASLHDEGRWKNDCFALV